MHFTGLFAFALLFLSASARIEPGSIRARADPEVLEYARANEWTNAKRLANGLPPAGPKFRRATPVQERGAGASPAPVVNTGHFGVRSSSGSFLGYLSGTSAGVGGLVQPGDPTQLDISLSTQSSSSDPTQILVTNVSPNFYVGGLSSTALASGSAAFVTIGSIPTSGGSGEASIWTVNPQTRELTAQWVNPDGSKPQTAVVYSQGQNLLYLTGDATALNSSQSGGVQAVRPFLSG